MWGATEVYDKYPFSAARCIQVEDYKEFSTLKIEEQISNFVQRYWNSYEDGKWIDNGWRADKINTTNLTFDIVQNGNKKGVGYADFESWASIKRV